MDDLETEQAKDLEKARKTFSDAYAYLLSKGFRVENEDQAFGHWVTFRANGKMDLASAAKKVYLLWSFVAVEDDDGDN